MIYQTANFYVYRALTLRTLFRRERFVGRTRALMSAINEANFRQANFDRK